MSVIEAIRALEERRDLGADDKRVQLYTLKVTALLDVIGERLVGKSVAREGFTFRINRAHATEQSALFLDVTFTRPPDNPVAVRHQITIVNPPLLPRSRTGNEKEDLLAAVGEMLEGFI